MIPKSNTVDTIPLFNGVRYIEFFAGISTDHYGDTGCGVFKQGGTKLERFLQKNQHTQRKLLNFEFWINGELSKIGHHFSNKVI